MRAESPTRRTFSRLAVSTTFSGGSVIRVDENDRARTFRNSSGDPSTWVWRVATVVDYDRFLVQYLSVMAK